ncbi:MAG: nucleoid-associated protein YgaU [Candidatus Endobugula sp.]|jgi:nucleoid-associated protein YgaU
MRIHVLGYLIIFLVGLSPVYVANAQTSAENILRADYPSNYIVIKGDTLWDISARFLKDPWRWKEIWQDNSHIVNPDLIYPGDVIGLVFVDGKPQLTINVETTTSDLPAPPNAVNMPLKTVKLSPQIRASSIKTAIPAIPLATINTFLSRNRVIDDVTLKNAPHVLAGQENRVILSAGDSIYARGKFPSDISSYGLYRKGKEYIDPETKKLLGVQAIDVGAVSLLALSADIGTFTIIRSTNEVRVGDRLISNEEREIISTFFPKPPENHLEGIIMNVERGVSQAGRLDIIAVNLGKGDGLELGHILGIFKRRGTITDRFAQRNSSKKVKLPDVRAGLVMVFQVFDKMSLAIILEAESGVALQDIVRTP